MSDKAKTSTNEWKRISDRLVVRTADPLVMLGRFTNEAVIRHWMETFIDEDTGEKVEIERGEIIEGKGQLLDKNNIQRIMFHIQAGDIDDIEVTDMDCFSERFVGDIQIPCEVTISSFPKKETYLVRAQTIENAIRIATEYATIYHNLIGLYTITKAEFKGYKIIQADDPCIEDPDDPSSKDQRDIMERLTDPYLEYYHTTLQTMFVNECDKMKIETREFIIPAGDVGQAKERTMRYAKDLYDEKLKANPANRIKVIKAKPYDCAAVPPKEYCDMFKQETTYTK